MEVKAMKFTPDQAFQIILKGMETGQVKMPFNRMVKPEEMEEILKSSIARSTYDSTTDVYSVTHELMRAARLDSIYLLTLYHSLTEGLTEEEANQLNHQFHRFL